MSHSKKSLRSTVIVYTDGACKGNQTTDGRAGIGVFWGLCDERNIAERCPGTQTNNRAEMIAIARALEQSIHLPKLIIMSDSEYCINTFTKWIDGYRSRGWKTSKGELIKNLELVRYVDSLMRERNSYGFETQIEWVKGHSNNPGNDAADALANKGASLPPCSELDWSHMTEIVLTRAGLSSAHLGVSRELWAQYQSPIYDQHNRQRTSKATSDLGTIRANPGLNTGTLNSISCGSAASPSMSPSYTARINEKASTTPLGGYGESISSAPRQKSIQNRATFSSTPFHDSTQEASLIRTGGAMSPSTASATVKLSPRKGDPTFGVGAPQPWELDVPDHVIFTTHELQRYEVESGVFA